MIEISKVFLFLQYPVNCFKLLSFFDNNFSLFFKIKLNVSQFKLFRNKHILKPLLKLLLLDAMDVVGGSLVLKEEEH